MSVSKVAVTSFALLAFTIAGCAVETPSQEQDNVAASGAALNTGVPFKGALSGTEVVVDADHDLLTGTGTGTLLGNFSYSSQITIDHATSSATGTAQWTGSGGDVINATFVGQVIGFAFPFVTFSETLTVTGGTGHFSGATGTIVITRTLNVITTETSGSFSGTVAF